VFTTGQGPPLSDYRYASSHKEIRLFDDLSTRSE
jgi:hypothetical protein